MDKSLQIRKRVLSIYNRRQDDFNSLREYNDYLEEAEDIIFNLSEGIDVKETEAKLAAYKRENEDMIALTAARRSEEECRAKDDGSKTPTQGEDPQRMSTTPGDATFQVPRPSAVFAQPTPIELRSRTHMVDDSPEAVSKRWQQELQAGGYNADRARQRAQQAAYNALYL